MCGGLFPASGCQTDRNGDSPLSRTIRIAALHAGCQQLRCGQSQCRAQFLVMRTSAAAASTGAAAVNWRSRPNVMASRPSGPPLSLERLLVALVLFFT